MQSYYKMGFSLPNDPKKPVDGWMTCDFTSFLTVFLSYQDDGRLIMKSRGIETCLWFERFPPPAGLYPGMASSVGKHLTY